MRPGILALLVLVSTSAAGCGIKSTAHLVAADRAVQRAEERGAAENALYEYTLAVRYLDKAREESAHARYGDAISLAREAEGYADKAVIVMQEKGLGTPTEAEAPAADVAPAPAPPAPPAPTAPAPTEAPTP